MVFSEARLVPLLLSCIIEGNRSGSQDCKNDAEVPHIIGEFQSTARARRLTAQDEVMPRPSYDQDQESYDENHTPNSETGFPAGRGGEFAL